MQTRLFFKRSLLFGLPLMMWVLAVLVIDPFNYFNLLQVVPEQVKMENAAGLNTVMFNMLKHTHDPCENLVIGDSRVEYLSLDQIEKVTGKRYFRLNANAMKLNEAVDLFWFAHRLKPLKNVVFTINFNQYNEYAYADRVRSVEAMIDNPMTYIFDRSVAQAVYYVAKAAVTGEKSFSSKPPMSPEAFWDYMVNVLARQHYGRYRYPDALYKKLEEMVAFAKKEGVEVTFVVVPHHQDFQRRVREFKLVDEYLRFKRDLSRLGVRVIDYDFVSELTLNKSNFRDPIHYNQDIGKVIVDEVFGGKLVKGKLLDQAWAEQCSKFVF
jgi:hypothetical protein